MAMREVRRVRQIEGEPLRRWFSGPEMDLVVWHEEDRVVGFQLCYDKHRAEKAVTWRADTRGLWHTGVDSGEGRAGRFKATPILLTDGRFDAWHVCGRFLRARAELPHAICDLVCRQLTGAVGNAEPPGGPPGAAPPARGGPDPRVRPR